MDNYNNVLRKVDYIPNGERVNPRIAQMLALVDRRSPDEIAEIVASEIAAMTYLLLSGNDQATVRHIIDGIVSDTVKRFHAVATKQAVN